MAGGPRLKPSLLFRVGRMVPNRFDCPNFNIKPTQFSKLLETYIKLTPNECN